MPWKSVFMRENKITPGTVQKRKVMIYCLVDKWAFFGRRHKRG
jgi:hypothetical protein